MSTRWSPTTKYIVAIGLALAGIGVLYISRPVLGMVIAALILTFLTYPVVRFLHTRWRFPRGLAAITAYLLLALILALIPVIVTPIAIDAVRAINVDAFVDWLQAQIGGLESRLISLRTIQIYTMQLSLAAVVDPILEALAGTAPQELTSLEQLLNLIPGALGSVTSLAGFLATTISNLTLTVLLTVIIAVYLAIDADRFYQGVILMMPVAYRQEYRLLLKKTANVWSAFFRGQITVSVILALITWIGATAVGLPGAFILGLTSGVLALIPSLGPVLALIPAVIVALVQGSTYLPVTNLTFALIVLGLYVLIQQLEGNLITPRIVGQAIDLPPVMVLVGVVIGTSFAGLYGAVLAAPVVATGKVLFTYAWNKMLDQEPFTHLEPVAPVPAASSSLSEAVRSTYQQLQIQYQRLAEAARPWPGDEEE